MAQATPDDVSPPPTFNFSVTLFDGVSARFQEVAGMDSGSSAAEYRPGRSPAFFPVKRPGLGKVGKVTLRRGVFANDARFQDWYDRIRMGTLARGAVVITLLDAAAVPEMTWTLNNARPTRITGADLKSEGSEVAVDSIEIAYETVTTATP